MSGHKPLGLKAQAVCSVVKQLEQLSFSDVALVVCGVSHDALADGLLLSPQLGRLFLPPNSVLGGAPRQRDKVRRRAAMPRHN